MEFQQYILSQSCPFYSIIDNIIQINNPISTHDIEYDMRFIKNKVVSFNFLNTFLINILFINFWVITNIIINTQIVINTIIATLFNSKNHLYLIHNVYTNFLKSFKTFLWYIIALASSIEK